MNLDFEAARQRADDRLNQELTRIRNLPKRSKITICNKHGLQHAHHMNTGLVKNLEVDLSILKREKRRVLNELNKKKREFADSTQKSFPRLLAIPGRNAAVEVKKQEIKNKHSPQRFKATWGRTSFSTYFTQKESERTQQKREVLIAITEQSKKRTNRIIEQNIQKMENNIVEDDGFIARLNKRELSKSCFPSLLDTPSIKEKEFRDTRRRKADSFYKGTTYFMAEDSHNVDIRHDH
ncbi:uncharacterized protein LOC110236050 [Exaiptasia diaphana]|uniref:Uncharacterized protein n=1 Tax=Exaiptasia diaphana TaxID=2652724 RepID=A0A913X106_EXADI|nr:uncharacterized protein LOC110236050 [Exaiptasia diaphana]KXJ16334.1 hypothetical protein AC249_AIPGENE9741 [Exaiptasia diaphana]